MLCGPQRSRLSGSGYASTQPAQLKHSLTLSPTPTGTLLLKIALQPIGLHPWDVVSFPGSTVVDALFRPCGDGSAQDEATGNAADTFTAPCDGPSLLASRSALPATEDEVVLVASMHCARSISGARQEKDCRLALLKVACSTPEGGLPRMRVMWQHTRELPKNFDHGNMMCADTGL